MKEREILRRTSRSFHLTLRVLPPRFRAETSLGYLLARATDTIADTSDAPAPARAELLRAARASLDSPEIAGYEAARWGASQREPAERRLLEELPVLWRRMHQRPAPQRALLVELLAHVLEGQIFDLVRFGADAAPLTDDELERYTYLVAGSVGEFWTGLAALGGRAYADAPHDVMLRRARCYGQGLQLVNILRDRSMDEATGRCYVPAGRAEFWDRKAREWLGEAGPYCSALHGGRLRYASLLPALLGLRTLALTGRGSPHLITPVKVPRYEVRLWMRRGLRAWFSSRAVEPLLREAGR